MKFPDLDSLLTVEEQFEAVIEGAELMTPFPREQWPKHIPYIPQDITIANARTFFGTCFALGRECAEQAVLRSPLPWSEETRNREYELLEAAIEDKLSAVDTSQAKTSDLLDSVHNGMKVFAQCARGVYDERIQDIGLAGPSQPSRRRQ